MNSNYQWQKLQANDRIQARMREAATQRLVKGEALQEYSLVTRIWNKIRLGIGPADYRQEREEGEFGWQESSAMSG